VHRWLAAQQDRIALFFLPGYSPELNPGRVVESGHQVARGPSTSQGPSAYDEDRYAVICAAPRNKPAKVRRYFARNMLAYAAA